MLHMHITNEYNMCVHFVGEDNDLLKQELDATRDHEDSESESEEVP